MQNTTDPRSRTEPVVEGAGAVAKDSLAADSVRQGGGFAANRDAGPLGVEGSKSTLANDDTTNAVKLDAASAAAERGEDVPENSSGPGGAKYPEGAGGQPHFPGAHNKDEYVGGGSGAKSGSTTSGTTGGGVGSGGTGKTTDASEQKQQHEHQQPQQQKQQGPSASESAGGQSKTSQSDSATEQSSSHQPQPAPTYVEPVIDGAGFAGSAKPKGKNLHEGGFDEGDDKNASFNSDIGTEDDPGRAAENKFSREVAESGHDAGRGPRQQGTAGGNEGQYGVLETDQQI